ncbi:2,4-dihydroxyhept-2-ene-1,7-dioic acid aldolase [Photobacterium gaetbulicola]|uniref:2,4-dihydroxyhept-2-ene-1,7-dioic acid aldolase n=1 Tax=Photobacterium gaetbulicola TaxID=1295392 RepID=A0A0B9FZV2_9GAMM|nr:2,4-dihydroxyhept-2-ene-1,7-dioic acid aldolase [Photobacterium gaetbulicola]
MVNSWLSIPSSYAAEVVAHTGVDSVTIDMQHGMVGFTDVLTMFQAISTSDAIPMVRVPAAYPDVIMKMLDAGAYGIICPSVDTPEICKIFVDACRYPPLGNRSFGPTRGLTYGGSDYVTHADNEIMTLAMIESQQALDNLEAILDTEGLTGIYVGPNDLSFSLGVRPGQQSEKVETAISHILERAKARNLFTGIFCSGLDNAQQRIEQGFDLVTPGNDAGALRTLYTKYAQILHNREINSDQNSGGY